MKKSIITITVLIAIAGSIGIVLAGNKAKITKAAHPVKEKITIPVSVREVKEDSFATDFTVNGTTAPLKEVKIASEVQGKLIGLYVSNGDMIRAGEAVALLDASVLRVQLKSIEASIAKSELDLRRYQKLVEMGGATPMQVENVELQLKSLLAQKKEVLEQVEHMCIRAPFDGRIENVGVELGAFVSYGTTLSQLIDLSSLKINIYLSEQEAFLAKKGQAVQISSIVLSKPLTGHVSMISNKADASGKFLTEISLSNNSKDPLKAGILADVHFTTDVLQTGLSIPDKALLSGATAAKVFVVKGDHVEQKSIKTGITSAGKVQVLEGLQAGEQVVVSGQLNLENGTTISINQ
jgi:RND family efflux transporter MFP subunit